eukprot:6184163-Pleurochrysis_carterae.AAC.1
MKQDRIPVRVCRYARQPAREATVRVVVRTLATRHVVLRSRQVVAHLDAHLLELVGIAWLENLLVAGALLPVAQ